MALGKFLVSKLKLEIIDPLEGLAAFLISGQPQSFFLPEELTCSICSGRILMLLVHECSEGCLIGQVRRFFR